MKYVERYVSFIPNNNGTFECFFWQTKPEWTESWLIKVPVPEKLWQAEELTVTLAQ